MKLIIQIPCFNEERYIGNTIDQLPRKIEGIDEIERCFEMGIKGVGELHPDYQGIINCQLSELRKFFNYCENKNLPVVVHASEPIGKYYPGKGTFTSKYILELVSYAGFPIVKTFILLFRDFSLFLSNIEKELE